VWQEALDNAWPQWQLAIGGSGWHHVVFALGYGLCAWLCFASGHAARQNAERGGGWFAAAALLASIGLGALLQADVFLVLFMRSLARLQGWYGERHGLQLLMIGAMCVAGLGLLGWLRTRLHPVWAQCAPAVLGTALLATLAALRVISSHDTDAVMNLRMAGVSTGRLMEAAGLCLVAAGALRWLRTR